MVDIASLSLKIDASQVDPAAAGLDKLTAAGARAEVQTNKVTTSTQLLRDEQAKSTSAVAQMAQAVLAQEAAYKQQFAAASATAKAQTDYVAATNTATVAAKNFDAAGRVSAAGVEAYQAKMIAATMAQAGLTEAQARAALGIRAVAEASVAGKAATLALGAAHGAAGEQVKISSTALREFFVIAREFSAGRWNRIPGSLSILAGQFGLMTASALGTAAAVLLLAAPFIAFAAALALGSAEAAKLNNALTLTHNAVGQNASQITASAESMAKAMDYSQGKSIELYTHLVASGKVTGESLDLVASASIRLSQLTGETATKISDELLRSFSDASKGAADLNEKYHFLTLAQYSEIEALQKAGDAQGAFTLAMRDLSAGLVTSTAEMGFFEYGIHKTHMQLDGLIQAMKDFGKAPPIETQVFSEMAKLNSMDTPYNRQQPGFSAAYAAEQAKVAALQTQAREQIAAIDKQASDAATQEAGIAAKRHLEQVDPALGGSKQRMLAEIKDYKDAVAAALRADPADKTALADQENMAVRIAAIAKKYDKADYGHHKVDRIQEEIAKLRDAAATNREVAAAYDLSTAAGFRAAAMQKASAEATKLHTDVARFCALELEVAVTKALADGEKTLDQDRQKIATQTQVNAIMTATGVSQQVANKQVADATEIAKLEAAQASAKGADLVNLTKLIGEKKAAQAELNAVAIEAVAIAEHKAATNEIATLNAEIDLIGKSNRERVVQLALLKEAQVMTARGVQPGSAAFAQGIFDTSNRANKQVDLSVGQEKYNTALAHTQVMLGQIEARVQSTGKGLTDAFGHAGTAVVDLTSAFLNHAKALAVVNEQRQKYLDLQKGDADPLKLAEFDRQAADIRITAIGDELAAAANFFGQQTAAYQVLKAAEEAYRIFQFAMAVKAIFFKGAESAATVANAGVSVASDATTTASTLISSALKATAHGVVAIARAMASLPFPFNIAAGVATAAALVAFGVKLFGGGGGGSSTPQESPDAIQKAQGAGTVLGDATAQSKSIADSLTIVVANSNKNFEFYNPMLRALRNIDSGIGSLTSAIARQIGVTGGAFDTSGLKIGTSSKSGFLGLFGGSTTTRTLYDQGLNLNGGNLAQILAEGIQGATYQVVQSVKTSKGFLGIGGGTKTTYDTSSATLDADIAKNFTDLLAKLRDGVVAAGDVIGVQGAKAILDAFQVSIGKISFNGMSSQQIQDTLNAVFSKVGDQMAAAVLPMLSQLQKAGEGAFETLARVAREYQVVDVSLQSIGKTFGAVGLSSVAARDSLVQLFASLDDFVQQTQFFADTFLTEAQRIAPMQAAVVKEFQRLGITGVNTKDQFAQLVLGLDLTTEAGQQMYAALLAVAPAFAKVFDYLNGGSKDVTTATDNLTKAYQAQAATIQSTIDQFTVFTTNLKAFRASLDTGPNALLSPEAQYNAAQATFLDTSAKAKLGEPTALGALQADSQSFLDASKAYYASSGHYFQDLDAVKAAVTAAQGTASRTVDNATAQLTELKASVSGLIKIDQSVLSVKDAIVALQAALAAAGGTTNPFSPLTSPTGSTAPSFTYQPPVAPSVVDPTAAVTPTFDPNTPLTPAQIDAIIQANIANGSYSGGGLSQLGNVQMFATGGSGMVGGSGPPDSKRITLALSPGELVNVRRGGQAQNDNAEVVAELKANREELQALRATLARHGEAVVNGQAQGADQVARAVRDQNSSARLRAGGSAV